MKRKGQVLSCIMETAAIIEDCRAGVVGGIMAGIEIWEIAILPFLLNNCETWIEISKKSIETLEDIQYMFLRYLMATPRSCPIPSLLWETGSLMMEHRIAKKKLLFYYHLLNLPVDSLAYEVADIQAKLSFPGLVQECQTLIEKFELPDISKLSKAQWKKSVNQKIREKNRMDILERSKKYKKIEFDIMNAEKFETKSYLVKLHLADARLRFSIKSKMTKTIQMNFKGDPKYSKNLWKCQDCHTPDTQEHVVRCPTYQQLRVGKDLGKDKDLVDYFRKVIENRMKIGNEKQVI